MNEPDSSFFQFMMGLANAVPEKVRIRIVACLAFVGLIVFILIANGKIPFFGDGFAPADTVNEGFAQIRKDRDADRANEDKDAILTLRQTECYLPKGQSKALYTQTITVRMQDYFKMTGTGFQLPDCTDF